MPNPIAMNPQSKGTLGLNDFQRHTEETDKNPLKGLPGLQLPILGLFGEVGSLLSALKKRYRDAESFIGYADAVIEEFGDVLWYFSNIALRSNLDLSVLAQRVGRQIQDWDEVDGDKYSTFADLQSPRRFSGPTAPSVFQDSLITLAGTVGSLLTDLSSQRIADNRDVLSAHLVEIFRALIDAAEKADVDLQDVANRNVRKTLSRWPTEQKYTPLFDGGEDAGEQLPRLIEMEIVEKSQDGKAQVVQRCRGINIGDCLTDNIAEHDDYRFHDVFHLAYAAVLGWSPVTRTLFQVKRKSNPRMDEEQDGGRAIVIEEAVAALVFNHAKRLDHFSASDRVDYSLLKAIRELTLGYEVDACPLWMWERAILQGFDVFRLLRRKRGGIVQADLKKRTLTFKELV